MGRAQLLVCSGEDAAGRGSKGGMGDGAWNKCHRDAGSSENGMKLLLPHGLPCSVFSLSFSVLSRSCFHIVTMQ